MIDIIVLECPWRGGRETDSPPQVTSGGYSFHSFSAPSGDMGQVLSPPTISNRHKYTNMTSINGYGEEKMMWVVGYKK